MNKEISSRDRLLFPLKMLLFVTYEPHTGLLTVFGKRRYCDIELLRCAVRVACLRTSVEDYQVTIRNVLLLSIIV